MLNFRLPCSCALLLVINLVLVCSQSVSVQSPCPSIFDYEIDGSRVYGKIVLQEGAPESQLELQARFSITGYIPNYGTIELINEKFALQNFNQGSPLQYRVHFPEVASLPRATAIVVNGNTICTGPDITPRPNQMITKFALKHVSYTNALQNSNGEAQNFPVSIQLGDDDIFYNEPYPDYNKLHSTPPPNPCSPPPCGANAMCKERNGVGSCSCQAEYFGDPYTGCRPECVSNSDCDRNKACSNNRCKDHCPGACGTNAECRTVNHSPTCTCLIGYTGNPFVRCEVEMITARPVSTDPCHPSPCEPNSLSRTVNGHCVCTCEADCTIIGTPPAFRPECIVSSECPQDKACIKKKCKDPCQNSCGVNARCQVITHNPICTCSPGYTGDPFTRCRTRIDYVDAAVVLEQYTPRPPRPPPTKRPQVPTRPPVTAKPCEEQSFTFEEAHTNQWPRPVTTQKPIQPVPVQSQSQSDIECGTRSSQNNKLPLIYEGTSYRRGDIPWLVAIYSKKAGSLSFICGGTLVSNRHVVTAAHCMHSTGYSISDLVIKVGVHNINDWGDDQYVTRTLLDAVTPDSFENATLKNDIMVLTFSRRVQFNAYIRPACLWDGDIALERIVGTSGTVAGWGSQKNVAAGAGVPQSVNIPIVDTSTCRASNVAFHTLTSDKTFCAGDRKGAGPCTGDSGGGLYLVDGGKWRLRGVVSLSLRDAAGSCNLEEYVVFTDASQYLPWIRQAMKKEYYD